MNTSTRNTVAGLAILAAIGIGIFAVGQSSQSHSNNQVVARVRADPKWQSMSPTCQQQVLSMVTNSELQKMATENDRALPSIIVSHLSLDCLMQFGAKQ
jgi:hypothetical protein